MINLPRSASRESNCEDCGHVASSHRADDCWDCDRDARHCDGFLWFGVRYVEEVHPVTREMVKGRTIKAETGEVVIEPRAEQFLTNLRILNEKIGRGPLGGVATGAVLHSPIVAQDAVGSADE